MEIICINDSYPEDYLKIFAKFDIKYPKVNEICEITRVVKYVRIQQWGFFLKGYEGQFLIEKINGIEGETEVSFNSKRFVHLNGMPLNKEEIDEIKKNKESDTVKIPLKLKEDDRQL